jgi:hypothetical protein
MENPKIYLGFQVSYHCTENSYIITIAVQIQLQHFQAPKMEAVLDFGRGRQKWLKSCAWIYRPAFSWKQAQNAHIQSMKTSVLGLFLRKLGL